MKFYSNRHEKTVLNADCNKKNRFKGVESGKLTGQIVIQNKAMQNKAMPLPCNQMRDRRTN